MNTIPTPRDEPVDRPKTTPEKSRSNKDAEERNSKKESINNKADSKATAEKSKIELNTETQHLVKDSAMDKVDGMMKNSCKSNDVKQQVTSSTMKTESPAKNRRDKKKDDTATNVMAKDSSNERSTSKTAKVKTHKNEPTEKENNTLMGDNVSKTNNHKRNLSSGDSKSKTPQKRQSNDKKAETTSSNHPDNIVAEKSKDDSNKEQNSKQERFVKYMQWQNRSGPKAPGSKEIPVVSLQTFTIVTFYGLPKRWAFHQNQCIIVQIGEICQV